MYPASVVGVRVVAVVDDYGSGDGAGPVVPSVSMAP